MSKMIGIIGGMGAFAGMRVLDHAIRESAKKGVICDSDFPRILFYNLPVRGMDKTGITDEKLVLSQLRGVIGKMESFGCDVIVIACNTVHCFHSKLQGFFSAYILNIIDAACDRVNSSSPVGVICSETTKKKRLYEFALERRKIASVQTSESDQSKVNEIIHSVICGTNSRHHALELNAVISNLKCAGARQVILGCTELGAVFEVSCCDISVVDSGIIAVEMALEYNG